MVSTNEVNLLDVIKSDNTGKLEYAPFLQVLNDKEGDPDKFGLFLSVANAEAVGFTPDDNWLKHTHRFTGASQPTEGYISQTPRLVVVRRSGLGMFSRENGKYIGNYHKDVYNGTTHVLKTRYLVFLINKEGKLLHTAPLSFSAKGSFGANFAASLKEFQEVFGRFIGSKRNGAFFKNVVFDFTIKPQKKGQGSNTAIVSSITDWVRPTNKTLPSLYLTDKETRDAIEEAYLANEDFGNFQGKDDNEETHYTTSQDASNVAIPPVSPSVEEWKKQILKDLQGDITENEDDNYPLF